jgi:hypothetical protein
MNTPLRFGFFDNTLYLLILFLPVSLLLGGALARATVAAL